MRSRRIRLSILGLAAAAATVLAGCSAGQPVASASPAAPSKLVLVTHDSFALSDGILDDFTKQTGISVEVNMAGDAGELVNKLILTKDSPLGDVVYGIDNTFASRAAGAGVLEPYVSAAADTSDAQLPKASGGDDLTPIDTGDVCVNVDHRWFAAHGIPEPTSLDDLAAPAYKDLLVVEAANTSSPGLAFLLATIAAYGDDDNGGWQAYWKALVANGIEVAASWDDAYYADYSGPSSDGDRPLVVSYSTDPASELGDATAAAPTGIIDSTCFRQTEFAGVIAGTQYPDAAKQLVDFLLSAEVQADLPGSMYVYPVVAGTPIPDTWTAVGRPDEAVERSLDPATIDANREQWISEWAAIAQS